MKILGIFGMFKKSSKDISKVMDGIKKLKSGLSSSVKSENVTHPTGKFSGTFTLKTQKDLNIDEIKLSFNQYVYIYSHTGDYTWKEYFIGTQKVDGLTLRGGESKVIDFNIDYEFEMLEDEKKMATEKHADIKTIIDKMGYFRKNGKGGGREWQFKLVATIVLAGGEEIKEEHIIKVK